MAYQSYLIRKFDNTHENKFFRFVSNQLRNKYKDINGLHVFIGNISCNGHQIDALFIASGKIIVIDFKDYGGEIIFSENNPWQFINKNGWGFVKGGGNIRNPLQQVNAYRYSLRDKLSVRQKDILESNHDNFNFKYISGLVLFHQPIKFDHNIIPQQIRKYFDIASQDDFINIIEDRTSPQLTLTDEEIDRILKVLEVQGEHLYDEAQNIDDTEHFEDNLEDSKRVELVKRLLNNIKSKPKTEIEKSLTYYHILVNLERYKDYSIDKKNCFFSQINWDEIEDKIVIDLEKNPGFHKKFLENSSLSFPLDIFVGINFTLKNRESADKLTLLHTIIPYDRTIINQKIIEVPIENVALYAKELEDRNYPDDLIETLISFVDQKYTLREKIQVLKEHVFNNLNSYDIALSDQLILGFSESNSYTSHLISELSTLLEKHEKLISEESLLYKFLMKKDINYDIKQIDTSEFIEITKLNDKQRDAVIRAFNQPITVITGPPGTGKTQVVLNILANAILHNKKVLLASKNNKAVDNVKERLSKIIEQKEFFLRFGGKNNIREYTKKNIEKYIHIIHNKTLKDNLTETLIIQDQIQDLKKKKNKYLDELKKREYLQREISKIESESYEEEEEYKDWLDENDRIIGQFKNYTIENLNEILKNINALTNNLKKYFNSGKIAKIIFNILSSKLSSKKLILSINDFYNKYLKPEFKEFLINEGITLNIKNLNNVEDIVLNLNKISELVENGILLKTKESEYEQNISDLKKKLTNYKNKLGKITPNLEELIEKNQKELIEKNSILINHLIHERIRNGNANVLREYTNYIPDNIPYKDYEISDFSEITKKFLEIFTINSITNLSIKNAFPLTEELFDILVIDEASQCDIASAIPLVYRSKQIVIIGDPMQLKHITKVKSYEEKYILRELEINAKLGYDYVNNSLYDYSYDLSIKSGNPGVFLDEHFRCHPEIVEYSNKFFYKPKLGQELKIKTTNEQYQLLPKGIFWINSSGKKHDYKNINEDEKDKSIKLAEYLIEKYPNITIGITTPYREQVELINNELSKELREKIKVGTVHTFQGDERDIIIFSVVISRNSQSTANWINTTVPYLINVAVTRARNTLFIIGNASYCKKLPDEWPLRQLVDYVDNIKGIGILEALIK